MTSVPFCVAGGSRIDISVKDGQTIGAVRDEIAGKIQQDPKILYFIHGGSVLNDDSVITKLDLKKFPFIATVAKKEVVAAPKKEQKKITLEDILKKLPGISDEINNLLDSLREHNSVIYQTAIDDPLTFMENLGFSRPMILEILGREEDEAAE